MESGTENKTRVTHISVAFTIDLGKQMFMSQAEISDLSTFCGQKLNDYINTWIQGHEHKTRLRIVPNEGDENVTTKA